MTLKLPLILLVFCSLALLLFLNAGKFLTVADENPPRKAALIVILGGDGGSRLSYRHVKTIL